MAARVTWTTFSVLAGSHHPPPPHPAGHPAAPAALCAQTDPEVFFPGPYGSARHAQAICAGCGLRPACREWAIPVTDLVGVWGGTTERGRERARRARHATTPEREAA